MRVPALLLLAVLVATCAAPPAPERDTPFSSALIEQSAGTPATGNAPVVPSAVVPPPMSEADEWRGILPPVQLDRFRALAGDGESNDRVFAEGFGNVEKLAVAAYLRSPAVRAARERHAAARAGHRLSAELSDLASLYQAFAREAGSGMPYLGLSTLSGEIVARTVDMAFEDLRAVVRDTVAEALEVHADAVRLVAARRILAEQLDLERGLMKVLEARLESGEESQAALLAFQARVKKLETELAVLEDSEAVIRARVNRLLDRPANARVELWGATLPLPQLHYEAESLTALALKERQELRKARLAAERASSALRMAETMSLPHAAFPATRPKPGAKADFGVREGRVQEMRARRAALESARRAMETHVETEVQAAVFDVRSASLRLEMFESEVVPLSEKKVEAVRGAYEGNRAGYLDLLDATRSLLEARLAREDAGRNVNRAIAGLLRAVGVRTGKGD